MYSPCNEKISGKKCQNQCHYNPSLPSPGIPALYWEQRQQGVVCDDVLKSESAHFICGKGIANLDQGLPLCDLHT